MPKVTLNPSLKKKMERAIALKTAHVAAKIYNSIIISGEGDGFPYWSGAYINSWSINQTGKGGDVKQGDPGEYNIPGLRYVEPNYSAPYAPWFVANDYSRYDRKTGEKLGGGMAYQIEYRGTKTSQYTPWMTLHEAVNYLKFF